MSARRAITGPGLPPLRTALIPVFAMPVCTSMPGMALSTSATYAAVWTSS